MLTFLWLLTGTAVGVALIASLWARRLAKRVERLSQSYWELRYEHGQLSARLARLEPPDPAHAAQGGPGAPPAERVQTAFVPLSSLKK